MGYLRKALSISTLGLSNLVLDDESKETMKVTGARPRPRTRTKAKAKARATTGAAHGKRRGARAKARPAKAKARPARAEPKAAVKRKALTSKRTATTTGAKASARTAKAAKATTAKTPAGNTRVKAARPTKAASTRASAAKATAGRSAASAAAGRKPAARKQTGRTSAPTAEAPAAKSPHAAGPDQLQPLMPDLPPRPEASTTERTGAVGSGVSLALERIVTLHEHGALTDGEFAAAKARILGTASTAGAPDATATAFPAIEANVAAARRIDGYANPDREPSGARPGAPGGI